MRALWKSLVLTTALACSVSACGGDEPDDDSRDTEEGSSGRTDSERERGARDAGGADAIPDAGPVSPPRDAGPVSPQRDAGPTTSDGGGIGSGDAGSRRDGGTTGGDEVDPGTATVRIVNEHPSITVAELYLSPSEDEDWGDDLLRGRTLARGGVLSIRGVPCEEPFDLRIVTATNSESDQQGLVFPCDKVSTLTLSASPTQALRVLAP